MDISVTLPYQIICQSLHHGGCVGGLVRLAMVAQQDSLLGFGDGDTFSALKNEFISSVPMALL
jgi:hypothetical protein